MASIEVSTVTRIRARGLLHEAGVPIDRTRAMSLKQIQEHLDNFVSLGTLDEKYVRNELAKIPAQNAARGTPNAGKAWDKQQDLELTEHYRRKMPIATMASIRGRSVGSINARLQLLGYLKYNAETGKHEQTQRGAELQGGRETSDELDGFEDGTLGNDGADSESKWENNATKAGEFATEEQLNAMRDAVQDKAGDMTGGEAVPTENGTAVDEIARNAINSLSKRFGGLAQAFVESQQAIADTIAAEVKKVQGAWQRFEIKTEKQEFKMEGLAHKNFARLLRAVSARTRHDGNALNIWLYGPAGTGKSTAARKLAEAFSLPFHTNGPVGSQWDIRGFTDAQGRVIETAFRRAWIDGGVYCWDEGDGSAPAALIEANGALATGFAAFPDGTFPRHKDCIVIINGNLRPGAAPDATYNGRFKQDTAFVNRFVAIPWPIDEDLELALLGKLDDSGKQWVHFIRDLRRKVEARGIKGIVISPRQLQYGLALMDAGAPLDEVLEQTVQFMFTDEQWSSLMSDGKSARMTATEARYRKYA